MMTVGKAMQRIDAIAHTLSEGTEEQGIEAARQLRALAFPHRHNEHVRQIMGSSLPLRLGLLRLIENGGEVAQYWCFHCIVSIVHKNYQNQRAIALQEGMMEAILKVLSHGAPMSKGAACSALVESTFRNADNALLVAKFDGMMQAVVAVMQTSQGDTKDDAAGVLRNCSNYSSEATEVIVRSPGVLDALIDMCKGEYKSDRFTAMGTIQNLTRCRNVVHLLKASNIMSSALVPALHAVGSGEQHELMRAEALMAMTNLGSDVECEGLEADQSVISVLTQMALCAIQGEAWREVAWYDAQECIRPTSRLTLNPVNRVHYRNSGLIPVLKQLLGRWLDQQLCGLCDVARAEVCRRFYTCAGAEAMDMDVEGGEEMVEQDEGMEQGGGLWQQVLGRVSTPGCKKAETSGVAEASDSPHHAIVRALSDSCVSLKLTIAQWEESEKTGCVPVLSDDGSERSIVVLKDVEEAVITLANMAKDASSMPILREHSIPRLLRCVSYAVSSGQGGEEDDGSYSSRLCNMWVMHDRHMAIAMSHHPRLGNSSLLSLIDTPVLWLIMDRSCSMATVAVSLADKIGKAGGRGNRIVAEEGGSGARRTRSATAGAGASRAGATIASTASQGLGTTSMRRPDCRSSMLTAERGGGGGGGMTMADLTSCIEEQDDVCCVQGQVMSMSG